MYFKVLGPLEVEDRGRLLEIGGAKQRALLTILLLRANHTVSRDVLIDDLWGERPPSRAAHGLETHVSRLRKLLHIGGRELIVTRPAGYLLQLDGNELDLQQFNRLVEDAQAASRAGDHERAAETLRRALALWRGRPLEDVAFESFAQVEIAQLEERQAGATALLFDAELASGHHLEILDQLGAAVRQHPLSERFHAQLMLALYRSGRQAEALDAYRSARHTLVDELGIEPGSELRDLEQKILRQDASLEAPIARAAQPRSRLAPLFASPRALAAVAIAVAVVAGALAAILVSGGGSSPSLAIPSDATAVIGVLDPHSGRFVGRAVKLPAALSGIAAGGGYVWVTQPSDQRIRQVDPTSETVHQSIPVGSEPSGIAYGANSLWVANTLDGTVDRIDADTFDRTADVAVGGSPTAVAYRAPYVWVADSSDATLARIDVRTDARPRKFAVDPDPSAVTVGGGAVWVTSATGADVLRIDPRTGTLVRRIPVGNGPTALAYGAGGLWVANEADGTVSRIDPVGNRVIDTFPVLRDPSSLVLTHGGLWVGSASAGAIWRVDPRRTDAHRRFPVGGVGTSLAAEGAKLYVAVQGNRGAHQGGTLISLHNETCFAPSGVALLDPGTGNCPSISTLVYDGLVSYARAGRPATELVADLATGPPTISDGGKTYTFQVRRGMRYSTGTPVRLSDFRRAIERSYRLQGPAAYPALGGELIGGAACLNQTSRCDFRAGIQTDEAARTVTFHLVSSDPDFPYRLVYTTVPVPPGTPIRELDAHPFPGTGPYRVASNTGRQLTLVRNARFRSWSALARPNGYPDAIVVRPENGVSGIQAVERRRADLAEVPLFEVPRAALRTIETSYRSQAHPDRFSSTIWLILNTKRRPFDDVRVRRALSFAIDRAKLVRMAGGSLAARATCQVLPPGFQGYRPYCPYTGHPSMDGLWKVPDVEAAKALVASSGTRGEPVRILAEPTFGFVSILRYVKSVLDELGYQATLTVMSPNALGAEVAKPHTPMQLTLFYAPSFRPNASFFFNVPWFCTDLNGARYGFACPSGVKSLLTRATAAGLADPLAANRLWATIDREVVDRALIVPLYNGRFFDLVSKRVGNYTTNFSGALRDQMWVR